MFFWKTSEGGGRGGPFPIQKISLQIFCIKNGIFGPKFWKKKKSKKGGKGGKGASPIQNHCKITHIYDFTQKKCNEISKN